MPRPSPQPPTPWPGAPASWERPGSPRAASSSRSWPGGATWQPAKPGSMPSSRPIKGLPEDSRRSALSQGLPTRRGDRPTTSVEIKIRNSSDDRQGRMNDNASIDKRDADDQSRVRGLASNAPPLSPAGPAKVGPAFFLPPHPQQLLRKNPQLGGRQAGGG